MKPLSDQLAEQSVEARKTERDFAEGSKQAKAKIDKKAAEVRAKLDEVGKDLAADSYRGQGTD